MTRRVRYDFSRGSRFLEARARGGPDFSPVYFREGIEPYMRIAGEREGRTRRHGGRGQTSSSSGTSCLRSRSGRPDAHSWSTPTASSSRIPDISLVLRRATSPASSRSGRPARPRRPGGRRAEVAIALDSRGRQVLTAFGAASSPLGWWVFVEQPLAGALRAASARPFSRAAVLLLLGVGALRAGEHCSWRGAWSSRSRRCRRARRASGRASSTTASTSGPATSSRTLADQFNRTAAQLEESYATLEQKVDARTRELTEALEQQTATGEDPARHQQLADGRSAGASTRIVARARRDCVAGTILRRLPGAGRSARSGRHHNAAARQSSIRKARE